MWVLLSILAGFGDALRDTASKRSPDSIPPILISWSYSLLTIPFVLPLLIQEIPAQLPLNFWLLLSTICALHVLGGLVLVKSLNSSDFSIAIPLTAFSPVFLLLLGPIISGDSVSLIGAFGAGLVVCGSYLLNISRIKAGLLAPLKALVSQPGARGMFFLSFLWSVTSSIDRLAMRSYPLTFWAPAQIILLALFFLPIVIFQGHLKTLFKRKTLLTLLPIGACNALSFIPYLFCLQIAPAQYVICVKRTSILFSLLLGRAVFKEDSLGERALGATLMFLGVAAISLFG